MISINGKLLEQSSPLSYRGRTLLSLIRGGKEFLDELLRDKTVPHMIASSEDELLVWFQEGLHAEGWIRFNSFRADIRAVLSLEEGAIEQLAAVKRSEGDTEEALAPLLQEAGWYSYTALGAAGDAAAARRAQRPDLFGTPSFSELTALAALLESQADGDAATHAAAGAFAATYAGSVTDYVWLSGFYTTVAAGLPADFPTADAPAEIAALYTGLLPLLPRLLFTPQMSAGMLPGALRKELPMFLRQASFLGYGTPAAAALDLARNIPLRAVWASGIRQAVTQYLDGVLQRARGAVTRVSVPQDGGMTLVHYGADGAGAPLVLGVDRAGTVAIQPRLR